MKQAYFVAWSHDKYSDMYILFKSFSKLWHSGNDLEHMGRMMDLRRWHNQTWSDQKAQSSLIIISTIYVSQEQVSTFEMADKMADKISYTLL